MSEKESRTYYTDRGEVVFEEEPRDYTPLFEHPPNLEAIRQAIHGQREQGTQGRIPIEYDDLENQELI